MFKTHSSSACASSTDRLVRENVLVGLVTTQIVTKKQDKTGSVSGTTLSEFKDVCAGVMQGAFVFKSP